MLSDMPDTSAHRKAARGFRPAGGQAAGLWKGRAPPFADAHPARVNIPERLPQQRARNETAGRDAGCIEAALDAAMEFKNAEIDIQCFCRSDPGGGADSYRAGSTACPINDAGQD